ncbi:hypothetical protein T4D_13995 [Trichinella pseudospiralis]|uniref:Secreted protein n=1 Tax=Trichinella pseudospiralis TaxID=6337 RepID=A0A0V1FDX6_TRIPS|nr:hypothetical protein T4D_13995 [Trichinella pseudospiralis]
MDPKNVRLVLPLINILLLALLNDSLPCYSTVIGKQLEFSFKQMYGYKFIIKSMKHEYRIFFSRFQHLHLHAPIITVVILSVRDLIPKEQTYYKLGF